MSGYRASIEELRNDARRDDALGLTARMVLEERGLSMHPESRDLDDAWAALPPSVSGEAAPHGATLSERIRALTAERDHVRAAVRHCHTRHVLVEEAARAVNDAVTGAARGSQIQALDALLDAGYRAVPDAVDLDPDTVPEALVDAFLSDWLDEEYGDVPDPDEVRAGLARVLRLLRYPRPTTEGEAHA